MARQNVALDLLPANEEPPRLRASIVHAAPRLISQKTAAAVLGLTPRSYLNAVRDYAREGHRVGRHGKLRLVDASEFAKWLLEREQSAAEKRSDDLLTVLGLEVVR